MAGDLAGRRVAEKSPVAPRFLLKMGHRLCYTGSIQVNSKAIARRSAGKIEAVRRSDRMVIADRNPRLATAPAAESTAFPVISRPPTWKIEIC
jgi:hypothetical protein